MHLPNILRRTPCSSGTPARAEKASVQARATMEAAQGLSGLSVSNRSQTTIEQCNYLNEKIVEVVDKAFKENIYSENQTEELCISQSWAYIELGEYKNAMICVDQGFAAKPSSKCLLGKLFHIKAFACLLNGQYQKVHKVVKRGIRENPDDKVMVNALMQINTWASRHSLSDRDEENAAWGLTKLSYLPLPNTYELPPEAAKPHPDDDIDNA